ncbi:MAG: hypothetical protein U0271_32325, partial [Polyangiaceae bacterium]
MDLDAALTELFQAPLADFIKKRKELASALKRAGNKEGAAAVDKTMKPSPSAWAVNQLHHRSAAELGRVFDAGSAVREAQKQLLEGSGSGQALAAARAEQDRRVRACTIAALELLGDEATQAAGERIEKSLDALAMRGSWEGAPGRLTRDLGEVEVDALAALLGMSGASTPAPRPNPEKERAEKERAEKERAEKERAEKERAEKERAAREAREHAEREREHAERERERAEKERERVEREARELAERERERAEMERLEMEHRRADRAARRATIATLEARRREAEEFLRMAESRLEALDAELTKEHALLIALGGESND